MNFINLLFGLNAKQNNKNFNLNDQLLLSAQNPTSKFEDIFEKLLNTSLQNSKNIEVLKDSFKHFKIDHKNLNINIANKKDSEKKIVKNDLLNLYKSFQNLETSNIKKPKNITEELKVSVHKKTKIKKDQILEENIKTVNNKIETDFKNKDKKVTNSKTDSKEKIEKTNEQIIKNENIFQENVYKSIKVLNQLKKQEKSVKHSDDFYDKRPVLKEQNVKPVKDEKEFVKDQNPADIKKENRLKNVSKEPKIINDTFGKKEEKTIKFENEFKNIKENFSLSQKDNENIINIKNSMVKKKESVIKNPHIINQKKLDKSEKKLNFIIEKKVEVEEENIEIIQNRDFVPTKKSENIIKNDSNKFESNKIVQSESKGSLDFNDFTENYGSHSNEDQSADKEFFQKFDNFYKNSNIKNSISFKINDVVINAVIKNQHLNLNLSSLGSVLMINGLESEIRTILRDSGFKNFNVTIKDREKKVYIDSKNIEKNYKRDQSKINVLA